MIVLLICSKCNTPNGPVLDKLRDPEIRQADTVASIQMFHPAFQTALCDLPPRDSSGIDVSLAAIPFGALVVKRAFAVELPPAQRYS